MSKIGAKLHQSPAPTAADDLKAGLKPLAVLALAAWCGLAAGLLEVAATLLATRTGRDGILRHTRHFVWMIPFADFCLFVGIGAVLALLTKRWPRHAEWLSTRLLGGLVLLPALLILFPRIHASAMFFVATGIASVFVIVFWSEPRRFRFRYRMSFAPLVVLAVLPSIWVFGGDAMAAWRESTRPLPAPGSPNVLLIVLDTVRADHLSLYDYSQPTTPNLKRLAQQGIRFNSARSTAPWTLPSHASMFTGRWPHELGVGPFTALDAGYPTLAEYLGWHGYATGGFVGNMDYCTRGTGLSRGFTCYEDRVFSLKRFKMAQLVDIIFQAAIWLGRMMRDLFHLDLLTPVSRTVFPGRSVRDESNERVAGTKAPKSPSDANPFVDASSLSDSHKEKSAAEVNRQFLEWLSAMPGRQRPFFSFLNYMDAHDGYVLPDEFAWRIGEGPKTAKDYRVISEWYRPKTGLTQRELKLGLDAYDNCIAYVDEQLGKLIWELDRRGELENTLVIITSDHGEEFGEHGFFGHALDLYQTQIRVPLLILLPSRLKCDRTVDAVVSLRALASTIVDVIGLDSGSPFPGRSLASLWNTPLGSPIRERAEDVVSELHAPDPLILHHLPTDQERSRVIRGPIVSVCAGDYVYIRNEGKHGEELYDVRQDPQEQRNLADVGSMREIIGRFRRSVFSALGDISRLDRDARQ